MTNHESLAKAYLAWAEKRITPESIAETVNQFTEAQLLAAIAKFDREWVDRNISDI